MSSPLSVFVSSGVYELRDIRVTIRDLLVGYGIQPQLSEDSTFPHASGVKPYVTCLETLEECPLVIGILENEYGRKFDDWAPYKQYNGLSPTHAELRLALDKSKKLLLYVHARTLTEYQTWRADRDGFARLDRKHGPTIDTLLLLEEMKKHDPAPWITPFDNASDIVTSLQGNLLNEIFNSLKEQERRNADVTAYLTDQILLLAPEKREEIERKISPALIEEITTLRNERESLASELERVQSANQESAPNLDDRIRELDSKLAEAERDKLIQQAALTAAALKDANWLQYVRTHYMPKQPGRVPFHNALEVALRGFHTAGFNDPPQLQSATWRALPYSENGLHRGYKAGLILGRFGTSGGQASRL